MRSKLTLALLGLAALFTGCNNENVEDFTQSKGTTSFNVSVEGGVQSRAAVTDLTRYVMEVYQGATATGTPLMHKEQTTGTFADVVLDNGKQYTVLFWADYGTPTAEGGQPSAANEYNAADLKAAFIAKQATKPAYAGLSRFTIGTDNEAEYTAVTLKHAVAQVNFKQTEALTTASNTLVVTYPKSYSLNVDGNAVTEIAGAVNQTFTYNSKEIGTLGTSYIIAATGTPKTMLDITATLNNETAKEVSNVPFERNFKTNISGAYSNLYDATLSVTCDDAWETPDNEGEIPGTSASDYIEVNGIKVAIGNLVADGEHGAKIGLPTDGGLYFQFGSLVGWSATGDPEIVVRPATCAVSELWNSSWTGPNNPSLDPNANDVIAGTGDPCRFYLGSTWRLPTNNDFVELFKNNGYPSTGPWTWDADSKLMSHTSGLVFPSSGFRYDTDGRLGYVGTRGYCWSASVGDDGSVYRMYFGARLYPTNTGSSMYGYSVRCVRD